MEGIGTVLVVAVIVYSLYELVTIVYAAKHPSPPYKDEDPVQGRRAIVCRSFSDSSSSSIRTGAVELNGSIWEAETTCIEHNLVVGDRCVVSGRNGLRLLVGPEL